MSVARLVPPLAVTEAILVSSNVAELPPAAWSGGTTYALGAFSSVLGGVGNTEATIYESLQAGNLGNAPASSPLWWALVGKAWLAWDAGTTYPALAIVTDPVGHRLYRSLAAGNLGNAVSDVTKWQDIGPSPTWAMFDDTSGTQTRRNGAIAVELQVPGRIDTIALHNIAGATARIEIESAEGVLYDVTHSLIEPTSGSWWEWFFSPVQRKTDLSITGLPYAANCTVRVTLEYDGEARIGNLICGLSRSLGPVEFGMELGLTSRSKKVDDGFGNWTITARPSAKNQRFTAWLPNGAIDRTYNLLAQYEAVPVLLIGAETISTSAQYGIIRSFGIVVEHATESRLRMDFEGM